MTRRILLLAAALAAAALLPQALFAAESDPLGLLSGARAVEGVVKRARQGVYLSDWQPGRGAEDRLSLSVLRLRGKGLDADLLALSARAQAFRRLWMSWHLRQPSAGSPEAGFGINWDTGPVAWSLTAATDRPSAAGLLPGADLVGTWRF